MHLVRVAAAAAALTLTLAGCGDQPARQGSEGASPSPSTYVPTDAEIDDQLTKGYDTAAKSDLRNLATAQEILLTDTNSYGTIKQIEANNGVDSVKVSDGVTVKVVSFDGASGYCLSGIHQFSETLWVYDSVKGGLLPKGETKCTPGAPGDEKAGARLPEDQREKDRAAARAELAEIYALGEKVRAAGPITEEERAQATRLVAENALYEGEVLIREALEAARPVSETDELAPSGPLPTLTELKASGAKLELPAGTSFEMTNLGKSSGEFGEEGFCLKATHELLKEPVYLGTEDSASPEGCPFPKRDGGQLRGLALTAQERERLDEDIENAVFEERIAQLQSPPEEEEPEETDPLALSLRNLAIAEETYLTDSNSYGTIKQIQASGSTFKPEPGVKVAVIVFDGANGYCLAAEQGGVSRFYDSAEGGLLPPEATGCTVTTKGTPGDSVTG